MFTKSLYLDYEEDHALTIIPDGEETTSEETMPSLTSSTTSPDGTLTLTYDDDTEIISYADGSIRITNSDGIVATASDGTSPARTNCANDENFLPVSTASEIRDMALDGKYCLVNDIDIGGISSDLPIGYPSNPIINTSRNFTGTAFTGTLDGNYNTISGLHIEEADNNFIGLFAKIGTNGEVRNLTIANGPEEDTSVKGNYMVGVLAGQNSGTITNVSVSREVANPAVIEADKYIGGLVGYNNGTITNSSAKVDITGQNDYTGGLVGENTGDGIIRNSSAIVKLVGKDNIGGLVGYSTGTITDSHTSGEIGNTTVVINNPAIMSKDMGGLVGENGGTIENSHSDVELDGEGSVGGLVGNNREGTITNSYATGRVEGGHIAGGLAGDNDDDGATITNSYATGHVEGEDFIGGLVGRNNETIERSYATGNARAGDDGVVGGLVGFNNSDANIRDSYATGSARGAVYVGRLVGKSRGTIERSYAKGFVLAVTYTGGLAGRDILSQDSTLGSIQNSYFDLNSSGGESAAGDSNGEGISTTQITYGGYQPFLGVGWDFTDIWKAEGTRYWPTLKWQGE